MSDTPRISVVMPTFNRPDALPRALAALAAQTLPPDDFEVVLVADAKNEWLPDNYPDGLNVRQRQAEQPGASAARNVGWRDARAPIVLFTGDDIIATPSLVAEHLAWHERNPEEAAGVLGLVEWAHELKRDAFMAWLDRGIQFDYRTIRGTEAGPGHLYTANVSLKRSMLERVGGFDAERYPFLYEDIDLGLRLFGNGFRLLYNENAVGEHLHQPRLEEWTSRMAKVATAERRWVEAHPDERAYFHDLFASAVESPPARGTRGRLLMHRIPREFPLIGRAVWVDGDLYFRQQLAPAFLEAWDQAGVAAGLDPRK
jgi:GT2 family glycosyltransferase